MTTVDPLTGDPRERLVSLAGDLWNALCSVGHDGAELAHDANDYCMPCAYVREYETLTGIPHTSTGPLERESPPDRGHPQRDELSTGKPAGSRNKVVDLNHRATRARRDRGRSR